MPSMQVLVQTVAATLDVAHLAEHAAVGAGNALDAGDGAVGVHVEVHGGHARHIDVLRGDLAAGTELIQDLVAGHETALAMGDGVMPSMQATEPLGFTSRSMEGMPATSTYCVAIWPPARS